MNDHVARLIRQPLGPRPALEPSALTMCHQAEEVSSQEVAKEAGASQRMILYGL